MKQDDRRNKLSETFREVASYMLLTEAMFEDAFLRQKLWLFSFLTRSKTSSPLKTPTQYHSLIN